MFGDSPLWSMLCASQGCGDSTRFAEGEAVPEEVHTVVEESGLCQFVR